MSVQDLLNTDASNLARDLGAGFRWWLDELAQMIPQGWRQRLQGRPALTAEPAPDGGYRFSRSGRPAAAPPRGRRTRVLLRMPREQALVRRLDLPSLSETDTRRLLTLDIDRLTPFRADQVYAAVACGRESQAEGRRTAVLAVIPRAAAELAIEHARTSGLEPHELGISRPDGLEATLDFLPQTQGASQPRRGRLLVWALIALLAVANLALAILRDEASLSRLRSQAEAEQPTLQAAVRLRRQVMEEDARRQRIVLARRRKEPLRVIDAATRALPNGAWVQRMSWDGQALRLIGYKQEGVDVAAALRTSPVFANVRNSTVEVAGQSGAGQPFDVTADAAQRPGS
jgi:general secretion pathway protein L